MPSCRHCLQAFEITQEDLAFYEKVSPVFNGKKELIPPPTLCPECRRQHRFVFRNEWGFHHRKCDLTGKQMISIYAPHSPYIVFDQHVWWSDAYDPLQYRRDVDLDRSFFDQLNDLHRAVPKSSIQNAKSSNCDYTNYSAENKDCYLVVGGLGAESTFYSYRVFYSKDIVDCFDLHSCERCYECMESSKLYNARECRNCVDCSDIILSVNCRGCRNCFGCVGLRNKNYYMFNEPVAKEEYERRMTTMHSKDYAHAKTVFHQFLLTHPLPFANIVHSEESTGDQVLECHHVYDSFTIKHSQDVRFAVIVEGDKDCYDINFADNCELLYNCTNQEKSYHVGFSALVWYSTLCWYSLNCFNSKNLFGCSGMKGHSYCILNKQYTEDEYERIVPKIIERMRHDREWGEFPDPKISPFYYNESLAHEEFPFTKEDIVARGWKWYDEEASKDQYMGPTYQIPDNIRDVPDDITKQILTCDSTGRPYKIIPQELKFYRDMNLPIPRRCPDQRHKDRMALRNPRRLWSRQCAKCSKAIETTYAPERPEIVYCESCYLETVY